MAQGTAQDRVDEIAARKQDPKSLLMAQLEHPKLLDFIRAVAPALDPRGVVQVAFAHVQATPALADCSIGSIVRAVAEAAKLGLTVDGILGHAYLVPFRERGTPAAKMMVGYRGFMHLAYRSGAVTRFHCDTIHEGDDWHYVEGVVPELRHVRPLTPRGELLGAYAMAHLTASAPPLVAVMGLDEIHARRARSSGFRAFAEGKIKSTPWETDYLAMARKCPVRELGKVIPYPVLQAAALRDEAVEEGRAVPDDKNVADLASWAGEGQESEKTAAEPPRECNAGEE